MIVALVTDVERCCGKCGFDPNSYALGTSPYDFCPPGNFELINDSLLYSFNGRV